MHCKYCSRLPIFLEIREGAVTVAAKLLSPEVIPANDGLS